MDVHGRRRQGTSGNCKEEGDGDERDLGGHCRVPSESATLWGCVAMWIEQWACGDVVVHGNAGVLYKAYGGSPVRR
jgi:hypothetical protein